MKYHERALPPSGKLTQAYNSPQKLLILGADHEYSLTERGTL